MSLSKWVVIDSVKDEIRQTTNKQTNKPQPSTLEPRRNGCFVKRKKGRKKENVERS